MNKCKIYRTRVSNINSERRKAANNPMPTDYTGAIVSSDWRNDFVPSTDLGFGQKVHTAHHSSLEPSVELSGLTSGLLPILTGSPDPPPLADLGVSCFMPLGQTAPKNDETLTTKDFISLSSSLLSVGACADRLPRPRHTIGVYFSLFYCPGSPTIVFGCVRPLFSYCRL